MILYSILVGLCSSSIMVVTAVIVKRRCGVDRARGARHCHSGLTSYVPKMRPQLVPARTTARAPSQMEREGGSGPG